MLPTPTLSHLSKKDFENVYEPAEDTFIFLDALEQDADELRRGKPRLVVEIGSGSGCVSAFIAQIIGDNEAAFLCTEINSFASECTQRTGKANKVHLEPVVTSMLSALCSRVSTSSHNAAGLVDVLLFNPPYVPTTEEEEALAQKEGSLAGAWAGGSIGTNLLDQLITSVSTRGGGIETILSPGGVFYFVAIKQNDPDGLVRQLQGRGLAAQIVLARRAGREHLFIIRARRAA